MKIYLASASKRRVEILEKILSPFEKKFEIINHRYPEKEGGFLPKELVLINSRGKLDSISKENLTESLIISADTVVAIEELILGKPENETEAKSFLNMLSKKTHSVFTGVVVFNLTEQNYFEGTSESQVTFKKLSPQQIENYISEYKPFDKAGGYGIQELGDDFIEKIEGSYSNIVGLHEELTLDLLLQAGLKK